MNPTDQEYLARRQRRDMDPRQQWTGLGDNAWRTGGGSLGERTNGEWEQLRPSPQRRYGVDSAAFTQDMNTDPDGEPVMLSEDDQELDSAAFTQDMNTDPDGEPVMLSEDDQELDSAAFTQDMNTDPDGEPVTLSEDDQELARKKKELQLIEERILLKKSSIAMKNIVPMLHADTLYQVLQLERGEGLSHGHVAPKSNEPSIPFFGERKAGFSYDKGSASNNDLPVPTGEPLKDRVNGILHQRRPVGFPRKVHSQPSDHTTSLIQHPRAANRVVERMNKHILSKDGLPLGEHPLKLRVKALMTQRRSYACVSPSGGKVPDGKPPPPSQRPSPTVLEQNRVAKGMACLLKVLDKGVPDGEPRSPSQRSAPTTVPEQNTVSKGLERFLNVLNKGVDINFLTKIVNEDSAVPPVVGELPPRSRLENRPELAFCRKASQGSHGMAPQQGRSRSRSSERRTGPSDQNGPRTQIQGISKANEKTLRSDDRGVGHPVAGGSSPASPGVVVAAAEEERKVTPEQQQPHDQLQTLLKTLGLSFQTEELSKLTDRTQERLYGKKTEERKEVESAKDERLRERLQRLHRGSSSSSSSSSGSSSPSPPPRRRRSSSSGKASGPSRERRRTPEHGHTRQRHRDEARGRDREGGTKPPRDRERAERRRGADEERRRGADEERRRGADEERRRGADEERRRGADEERSSGRYPENAINPFPHPAAGDAFAAACAAAASAEASLDSSYHSSTSAEASLDSSYHSSTSAEASLDSSYHSSTYGGAVSCRPCPRWAHHPGFVAPLGSLYIHGLQKPIPYLTKKKEKKRKKKTPPTATYCGEINTVVPETIRRVAEWTKQWEAKHGHHEKQWRAAKARAEANAKARAEANAKARAEANAKTNANHRPVINVGVSRVPAVSPRKEQPQEVKEQPQEVKEQPQEVKEQPQEVKEQPQEVKEQLTETEIKLNLKKKLEAFNQKMKHKPAETSTKLNSINMFAEVPDLLNFDSTTKPS